MKGAFMYNREQSIEHARKRTKEIPGELKALREEYTVLTELMGMSKSFPVSTKHELEEHYTTEISILEGSLRMHQSAVDDWNATRTGVQTYRLGGPYGLV